MTPRPPAVVLLSGGLDSATVLAMARHRGFDSHTLSFDYGQRHRHELAAASAIAKVLGATRHVVTTIDLRVFGGSALTSDVEVPKDGATGDVPITYVPARNLIFLSFAVAFAEVIEARDIFIGVNALDYSGYPDCRPEFLRAFEDLARVATAAGAEEGARFRVHAPLMELDKAGIVRRGLELGVDFALTWTCYDPVEVAGSRGVLACGRCDACCLRLKGFAEAGIPDPIAYAPRR